MKGDKMLWCDPPRMGDFVRDKEGNLHRVKEVKEKKGDHKIIFVNGGSAYWKRDGIEIISRDESFIDILNKAKQKRKDK